MDACGLLAKANVGENWIHHEDVRRLRNGQGPRPSDPELDDILWGSLALAAVLARRKLEGAGLVLKAADGRERTVKMAELLVTLRGQPDSARALDGGAPGVRGGRARR